LLGTLGISLLDLPMKFDEFAAAVRAKVVGEFKKYGLELTDFYINSISPPEEVQKAIGARSSMAAIGNLRDFTMYLAGNSMRTLAESGGGVASAGMGAGVGMILPGFIQQALQAQPTPPSAPTQPGQTPPTSTINLDQLQPISSDPRSLVERVAQAANWVLNKASEPWEITVPIGPLRKQKINVAFDHTDEEGHAVIKFSSPCGPASDQNALVFLRFNAQTVHSAFAVEPTDAGEIIVVEANQLADTADPLEITRTIAAIAWQADRVEEKLLLTDEN